MDPNFRLTTGQSLQLTYSRLPLRPFLARPSILPIINLPAQRTLFWSPRASLEANRYRKIHTIQSLHGAESERVATSFAVQVAGEEACVPCERCRKGDGEWAECVVPPVQFGAKT
ncbi:Fc.00g009290.m01.CDS01 [Cosmosporella sp. VM-42]